MGFKGVKFYRYTFVMKSACASAQYDQHLRCPHKKLCILDYPLRAQWRFWTEFVNAQSDLILRRAAMSEGTLADVAVQIMLDEGIENCFDWKKKKKKKKNHSSVFIVKCRVATSEIVPLDMCAQRRFRSACAGLILESQWWKVLFKGSIHVFLKNRHFFYPRKI